MKLSTLAKKYRDFFAPVFSISVSGQDLVRDLSIPVNQVEVDLMLGAASRFSFTVTDSYHPDSQRFKSGRGTPLPFAFGSEVSIDLGYRDSNGMSTVLQGVITEITTNFPENGSPELTVSGFDHAFPLTIGKSSNAWPNAHDSDVAHLIANFHNLNSEITKSKEKHAQIEQSQESDWAFLKKLADRNHFELFVDETKSIHFHPPNDNSGAIVELTYGESLLSFKPEANLAGQISGVEVHGWSINKEPIVGFADAGEESGRSGTSAADILNTLVRDPDKRPILKLRQPVFTQAEAKQRAQAAFNERAKEFLTGEGESIGLPEIRPDENVSLKRLGSDFSKTYYIRQATHKVDSNGYRTRFKVKETKQ